MPVPNLPEGALIILHYLKQAGYPAYAVGGCVRDALLGKTPEDWDICTAAKPEETLTVFAGCRVLKTGLRHGTVTVFPGDGAAYEVTTFRMDGLYSDHRHPDGVTFVTDIVKDLARRDFTVNAMAYHPGRGLIDPFHGEEDLRRRIIRTVGHPDDRFSEDGLRLLRALRFAARLDFSMERQTAAAIHRNAPLLESIAGERVMGELNGILTAPEPVSILRAYRDVLGRILPELIPTFDFQQHNPHHLYDVWEHTLHALLYTPPTLILRLAVLLHDIGKPACYWPDGEGVGHFTGHEAKGAALAEEALNRLRYDHDTVQRVTALIRYHDADLPKERAGMLRWLARLGAPAMEELMQVKRADARAHNFYEEKLERVAGWQRLLDEIQSEKACYTVRDLEITGKDLMAEGFAEGPEIGKVLQLLLNDVIDGAVPNSGPELLLRAKALAGQKENAPEPKQH